MTEFTTSDTDSKANSSGSEIVDDLLQRQDFVLLELDVLNDRIESTIKSITATRQAQIAAESPEASQPEILSIASERWNESKAA